MKKLKLLLIYFFIAALFILTGCNSTGEIDKMRLDGYIQRGEMYFSSGGVENILKAEQQYTWAFEIDPKNPIVLLRLGNIYYIYYESYLDEGKTEMAVKYWEASYNSYDKLRKLQPDYPEPYFGLATLFYCRRQYDDGISLLKKILILKSSDIITEAAVHKELGRFYNIQEKFPEAIQEFKEYIRLDPEADDAPTIQSIINTIEKDIKNNPEEPKN
jgi:tetratricopeptide (TPR) repeat protein